MTSFSLAAMVSGLVLMAIAISPVVIRMARSPHATPVWASSFQFLDFRLLWVSILFYSVGNGMEQVAVGWLVFELTGSSFMVGVVSAARMAPFFFLGVLSGTLSDRLERKTFLRLVTFLASGVAVAMAFLILGTSANVWAIIALVAAQGSVFAFALTIRQAYTVDIVGSRQALNGIALTSISMQAGGIAGSLGSGVLIEGLGPGWQYVAVGGCYAVSGLTLFAVRTSQRAMAAAGESVLRNLAGYIQLLRRNRTLLILMGLASITEIFGFTHMTLLPVFAKDVIGVGPAGLGIMTAVRQGGGLIGLGLLAGLRDYRRKGLLMFVLAGLFGVGEMAFSLSTNLYVFLVVLAVVNASAHGVDTLYKTLMQTVVAEEERGRAMGSWVLSLGTAPVGHLGLGAVASALGAQGALLVNGAVLAFVSLSAGIGLKGTRRLE